MLCRICGKPIEATIEGEEICLECWSIRQLDDEDGKTAPCPICGKMSQPTRYPTNGLLVMECPVCGVWIPDREAMRRIVQAAATIEAAIEKFKAAQPDGEAVWEHSVTIYLPGDEHTCRE